MNAVTVVGRQTFLTGRPERIGNVPRNLFKERVRVSAGRPQITPVRATALPDPSATVSRKALLTFRGKCGRGLRRSSTDRVALYKDVSVLFWGSGSFDACDQSGPSEADCHCSERTNLR